MSYYGQAANTVAFTWLFEHLSKYVNQLEPGLNKPRVMTWFEQFFLPDELVDNIFSKPFFIRDLS